MLDSNEPISAAEQAHWDRVAQQEAAFDAFLPSSCRTRSSPLCPIPTTRSRFISPTGSTGSGPSAPMKRLTLDWRLEAVKHEAERLRKLRYWNKRVEREKRGESVYSITRRSNYWIKSTRSDPAYRVDLQESLDRIAAERSIDRTPPLPPLP